MKIVMRAPPLSYKCHTPYFTRAYNNQLTSGLNDRGIINACYTYKQIIYLIIQRTNGKLYDHPYNTIQ